MPCCSVNKHCPDGEPVGSRGGGRTLVQDLAAELEAVKPVCLQSKA